MQEVQTLSRLGLPDTIARTRWMFGFQRRLVFFFDQGTLWPNPGLYVPWSKKKTNRHVVAESGPLAAYVAYRSHWSSLPK